MYNEIFQSLMGVEDFNQFQTTTVTKVANNANTLSINQFSWLENERCYWINRDTTTAHYYDIPLYNLYVGDAINMSCDIKGYNGFTRYTVYRNDVVLESLDLNTRSWETIKASFTVKEDGVYKVRIGTSTGGAANQFKIRDFRVKVQTRKNTKNYRTAYISVGTNANLRLVNNFANDPCQLSVTSDGYTLNVDFTQPLNRRGVAQVAVSYYNVDNKYIARAAYVTNTRVAIKIYPTNNADAVSLQWATLPQTTELSVIVFG